MIKIQSKFEQIYSFLMKEIEKKAIGSLIPCEAELSEKFSVNRMTVAKVMSALKSQGYIERKQGRGSTIIKKPAKEVPGIISLLPAPERSIDSPYFTTLIQTVSSECINNGFINICTGCPEAGPHTSFDYGMLNSLAGSGRYKGAIVIDTKTFHLEEWKEKFLYPGFPVVWCAMNHKYAPNFNCVDIDNRAASAKLVEILKAKGLKKIAFISSMIDTVHRRERFEGYQEAMGKDFDEKYVFMIEDEHTTNSGYRAAEKIAGFNVQPEALFFGEPGALGGIKEFSVKSGSDTLLHLPAVTFDYEQKDSTANVTAAVKQPFAQMAKEAFRLLTGISDGRIKTPATSVLQAEIIHINHAENMNFAI